jgi:hypothetical protein
MGQAQAFPVQGIAQLVVSGSTQQPLVQFPLPPARTVWLDRMAQAQAFLVQGIAHRVVWGNTRRL